MKENEKNMADSVRATAGIDDLGVRLDIFLSGCPGIESRSRAQQIIEEGRVKVSGIVRQKNYHLKIGDSVAFDLPEPPPMIDPENIELDIVHEDDHVLVINKPAGMVVHPGAGNSHGTLVNAALSHTRLASIGAPLRPGIVHRLDKNTSGLMVMAKTDTAYYSLVKQIKERLVSRKYLALVRGEFDTPEGRIVAPIRRSSKDRKIMTVGIGGEKPAVTNFRVLENKNGYSLVEAILETGRTHQIRVHFKFINHPVIGDPVYGPPDSGRPFGLIRQFLHAYKLEFNHPLDGERMIFEVFLTEDLIKVLDKIGVSLNLPI